MARYSKKPTKRSGVIEFAEGEYKEITWAALDSALQREGRGLSEEISSLSDLVEEECGIKNLRSTPVLLEEEIIKCVEEFMNIHQRKPNCNDGNVNRIGNLTWVNIDNQFRSRGSSLSKFIQAKFGIRAKNTHHHLSLSVIQSWIIQFFEKHEQVPKAWSQRKVEFVEGSFKGISWGTVHSEIKKGRVDSLPKETSLDDVIKMTLKTTLFPI